MKKWVAALGMAVALMGTSQAQASPIITVQTALAPNGFGSPNFAAWQSNAISAMLSGSMTAGTPGTPEYFEVVTDIAFTDIMVTSQPSWRGDATQVSPYDQEFGTRGHFPFRIDGNGELISASQLSVTMTGTGDGSPLNFTFGAGSFNYGGSVVGYTCGADTICGNGDDVAVQSGANTQMVNYIVGRGSGNAFWPQCTPITPCPPGSLQAEIDALAGGLSPFLFSGAVTLHRTQGDITGTGTFRVGFDDDPAAPEPAVFALFGVALVGSGLRSRRKRSMA